MHTLCIGRIKIISLRIDEERNEGLKMSRSVLHGVEIEFFIYSKSFKLGIVKNLGDLGN